MVGCSYDCARGQVEHPYVCNDRPHSILIVNLGVMRPALNGKKVSHPDVNHQIYGIKYGGFDAGITGGCDSRHLAWK